MGFEKGKSGNPEGRHKGALNKTTNEIRVLISKAIDTDKIKDKNQKTSNMINSLLSNFLRSQV